jgi:glycosyltransferase involved in cell wall biosynthesis
MRAQLRLTSEFVWLAAGRLMWKKDWPTLLRAFAAQRGAALLIAGEGPQEAELKALAAALEIDARFLGRVDDMPALMNAADAFALSSLVEGLPMALLEAAASGLPAVAADAGGVAEILDGGEAGFVVPVADSREMADAMSRVQSMPPDARQRMSRAARARAVERYDILVVVSRWEAAYRNLLQRSRWT